MLNLKPFPIFQCAHALMQTSHYQRIPTRALFGWSIAKRTLLRFSPTSATATASEVDEASSSFAELLAEQTGSTTLKLVPTYSGRGLVTEEAVSAPGQVLLSVPLETCIVVDYEAGLNVPTGEWPRLRRGVAKDESMSWDILQGLALLDGLAGAGDPFWARYSNFVLPGPLDLTLPVCLPERLLRQLQHKEIEDAAMQQKERLAGLFPGLAAPACEDGPTWMEWAFACVRSRAFQVGNESFAFVPFLDTINHALEPNADFQMAPDRSTVNLVSLSPIELNTELTISYTGKQGYTNQRLMAQYGFVPSHGNAFDRLVLSSLEENKESKVENPVLLSLDGLQAVLGDGDSMVDAFSGRDSAMYGALKSLPLAVMESDAAPLTDQIAFAQRVLDEVHGLQAEWETSLAEDEAALLRAVHRHNEEEAPRDLRMEAVIRYRVQRKKLLCAAEKLLDAFIHR